MTATGQTQVKWWPFLALGLALAAWAIWTAPAQPDTPPPPPPAITQETPR